tara:strand:- start:7800 stop:8846 length:1047 start_codon:yes stop_codon:yes gene_type:complete
MEHLRVSLMLWISKFKMYTMSASGNNERLTEMKKVVWPDLYDFTFTTTEQVKDWDRLNALADVNVYFDKPDLTTYLERCENATVIALNWVHLTSDLLDQLPNLELICPLAVSVNQVDLKHAEKLGITVCNAPHYSDSTMAEHALGLMLSLCRGITKADRDIRRGKWNLVEGTDLRGSTLGIIGIGGIGGELAAMGNALGMNVIAHTKRPSEERAKTHGVQFKDLDELLINSDFVQIAVTLTDETTHLIGKREFELMKPSAYLINISRAQVVEENSLLEVLRSRRIAGYATDVFEKEPSYNHPLAAIENVVVTPHMAWNTPRAGKGLLSVVTSNILAFLEGNPQNVVSR